MPYRLCHFDTLSTRYVIQTESMEKCPCGCSNVSWRTPPKPHTHIVCAPRKLRSTKKGRPATYCQVVHYLLSTYAIEDVIAEARTEVTNFKQPEHTSATRYSELSWEKAFSYGRAYEEARLKNFFHWKSASVSPVFDESLLGNTYRCETAKFSTIRSFFNQA